MPNGQRAWDPFEEVREELSIGPYSSQIPPLRYEDAVKMSDEDLYTVFGEHIFNHYHMFRGTEVPLLVPEDVDYGDLPRDQVLAIIKANQDWFDPKVARDD